MITTPATSVSGSAVSDFVRKSIEASRWLSATSAGLDHTDSEPIGRATVAWPTPSERAPIARMRSFAPSPRVPDCAWPAVAAQRRSAHAVTTTARSLDGRRFIDQHDGDAVADLIPQL